MRPKTKYLEVWIMLGRAIKAPQIRNVMKGSSAKFANGIRVTHRDEVEAPITDWLREAYDTHDALLGSRQGTRSGTKHTKKDTKTTKKKKKKRTKAAR